MARRGSRVLITAGPVWVPIDKVRVISNISTGTTGFTIAEHAAKNGAKVTLLLGPGSVSSTFNVQRSTLKIIRFRYYDELYRLLRRELKGRRYDVVIHAAAVSDYRLTRVFEGKIKSGKKSLRLLLKPTEKLIDKIKVFSPRSFLVMFKLETGLSRKRMLERAYSQMKSCKADLAVANASEDIMHRKHRAYIIDKDKRIITARTNRELADRLLQKMRRW